MLLDIRNLEVAFRTRKGMFYAVNGASLQVGKGEILAVVGESGSGKSQCFLSITGLSGDNAQICGEAWLDNRNLLAMDEKALLEIRGREIAYVFQDPMTALNPYLRIGTQLLEVLERHAGIRGSEAHDRVVAMLEAVRIPEAARRLSQYPHELSGGQRQRVMLAMALLGQPRLLIADEPTTALDVTVQRQILDLLCQLQHEQGFSLVIITHDLGVVARLAQRVVVMYGGRVMETAAARELFRAPRHPYTQGLLAATPRLDGGIPKPISGVPPKPDHVPPGCPFAPRCDEVENQCQQPVSWREAAPNHWIACWKDVKHD